MDPLQRSYSRRALLPVEQQIIDALGITVEEYWDFCRLADQKAKERGAEYEHIPDVVAGAAAVPVLKQIAISLLFAAASYLLTPKPEKLKGGGDPIQTADVQGQTRFAELFGFDSFQDLATLGTIIPLVFTKRVESKLETEYRGGQEVPKQFGGVRVKALMLWSQLLSKGSHQELKMLTTLGLSELFAVPDPQGIAVGEQLIRNYQDTRYEAYFKNSPPVGLPDNQYRVNTSNSFDGSLESIDPSRSVDVFETKDKQSNTFKKMFSGSRTPTSQRSFGCHSPISNGVEYFLPYEIVQVFDNKESLRQKRLKINGPRGNGHSRPYLGRQGMEELNGLLPTSRQRNIGVGETLTFKLSATREDPEGFPPHGLQDVNTAINQRASQADALINVGDLYMFGSAIIQCTSKRNEPLGRDPEAREYNFKCIEAGSGFFVRAEDQANSHFGQQLQRIDIGSVTNNRECHQTEIGIKSVVFKRVDSFSNVNSQPQNVVLESYEEDNQSFALGRVSTFQTRYSFFKLQAKRLGLRGDSDFVDILDERIFAVKGNTSQPQYNTITVNHDKGQYEFRFLPVSGSTAQDKHIGPGAERVLLLTGQFDASSGFTTEKFGISYTGIAAQITDRDASNPEFEFSLINDDTEIGGVASLNKYEEGELSESASWKQVSNLAADYRDDGDELIYGVLLDANTGEVLEAKWNRGDVMQKLGAEYQYSPLLIRNVAGKKGWVPTESRQVERNSGPNGNDSYIQTNSAGQMINVYFDGVQKASALNPGLYEAPDEKNLLAQYKILPGSQPERDIIPGVTQITEQNIFQDSVFDPINNRPAYFGVWETVTGVRNGFWNGLLRDDVKLAVDESQAGFQYIRGDLQRTELDGTRVYAITRVFRTVEEQGGYYWPVEKGGYTKALSPDKKLYAIAQYEFSVDEADFHYAPATYNQDRTNSELGTGLKITATSVVDQHWTWAIVDPGVGYRVGDKVVFQLPDDDDNEEGDSFYELEVTVMEIEKASIDELETLNFYDAITDYPKYDQEKTSHQDGPEHEISFVNELIRPEVENTPKYQDLSLLGLRLLAGKDWTSLGQLSVYVKQGIKVERLITDSGEPAVAGATGPTNNFAEVVYNLLTNDRIGVGSRIPSTIVDRDSMVEAARFCYVNELTFDGVLEDRTNLREFIFNTAALNFLDFSIKGGRFALKPSLPYKAKAKKELDPNSVKIEDYSIDTAHSFLSGSSEVKALFTDGNMKDMQLTFLPREERQLFKATITYRDESVENGFSSQKSIQVRFLDAEGGSEADPEESIDMTQFCTSRTHAELIGKYRLLLRKHIDHTITFKTTPSSALELEAGDYIKVISISTHTSRFFNGSIDGEGNITATSDLVSSDGYDIFYWRPGASDVLTGSMPVASMKTSDSQYFNSIFTLKIKEEPKRIYRIDSLTIDEDGYVDISATHQPLDDRGALATLGFNKGLFKVTS
tara:strand:+ start:2240 stop:6610 length:4371 start_codon:yes stop_codon:yes gene_type:complete